MIAAFKAIKTLRPFTPRTCAYKSHLPDPFFIKSFHNENIYSVNGWERKLREPKKEHPFHEWIRSWFISVWKSNKNVLPLFAVFFLWPKLRFFSWDHNSAFTWQISNFFRCTGTKVFTLCWSLNALCGGKSRHGAIVIHKLVWCNVAQFCGNLNHCQAPNWRQHQSLACFRSQITAFAQ